MTTPTDAEIRTWAKAHGHLVGDRGTLPAAVRTAYAAAHTTTVKTTPRPKVAASKKTPRKRMATAASPRPISDRAQKPPAPAADGVQDRLAALEKRVADLAAAVERLATVQASRQDQPKRKRVLRSKP